jgi:hypothetical protein
LIHINRYDHHYNGGDQKEKNIMIYIDRLPITLSDDRTAEVLITGDTLTLFVATEPVLHVEVEYNEDDPLHNFYRMDLDYEVDPVDIREALDYTLHNYLDDAVLTNEEFKALPLMCDINIGYFALVHFEED